MERQQESRGRISLQSACLWPLIRQISGLAWGDAKKPLSSVTRQQLEAFRDSIAASMAPQTVQLHCQVLRMVFRAAKERHGLESPAEFLKAPRVKRENERPRKAAFTPDELRAVIAAMDGEWKTLTLLGACTGARLTDLQMPDWTSIDLANEVIVFTAKKTSRLTRIPIAPPLLRRLSALPGREGKVLPALSSKNSTTLSTMFVNRLKAIGAAGSSRSRAV